MFGFFFFFQSLLLSALDISYKTNKNISEEPLPKTAWKSYLLCFNPGSLKRGCVDVEILLIGEWLQEPGMEELEVHFVYRVFEKKDVAVMWCYKGFRVIQFTTEVTAIPDAEYHGFQWWSHCFTR